MSRHHNRTSFHKRVHTILVRLSKEEKSYIERLADNEGCSVSEFVRDRCLTIRGDCFESNPV